MLIETRLTTYLNSTALIALCSIIQSSKRRCNHKWVTCLRDKFIGKFLDKNLIITIKTMIKTNNNAKSWILDKCRIWMDHMLMMPLSRAHALFTEKRERKTEQVSISLLVATLVSELASIERAMGMSEDSWNY